eukprot:CAMPEP_0204465034 /NCGR_PEP_ID=MMETSP0471-20130131/8098_1 /ASSEMBLY_ACC=CAM_ASM_000602 /TAXON_ID=2969 /ORGANISM="Oxyrrhis marina" /LENGTH=83 /DNA_ID=CAMNT_0051466545 /DNA_START=902 /DNA_END=1153 /DNA_ORIENTATION=-
MTVSPRTPRSPWPGSGLSQRGFCLSRNGAVSTGVHTVSWIKNMSTGLSAVAGGATPPWQKTLASATPNSCVAFGCATHPSGSE